MQIFPDHVHLVLDLGGVFFFAVSGALLAAHKGFDLVASFLLAGLTGLGGGVVRDVIIADQPPTAFADPVYLAPVVVATAVVYLFHRHVRRFRLVLLLFDAVGLGLFCVTGTVKAFDFDAPAVSAVALGVTTAVGGGLMRDVVAREVPSMFRADDIYALPAVAGASLTAVLWGLGALNPATAVIASLVAIALRCLGLWRGWRAPHSYARRRRTVETP